MLPTELKVNWPFDSGEVVKNRFSASWISDRNDFSFFFFFFFFDLQVTPMLPNRFQVNWPFGSGEEVQDGRHGGHLGFPIGMV